MTSIISIDNKIVKLTASLSEKKYRDKEGLYIIEGPNPVKEALDSKRKARFIFIKAESYSDEVIDIANRAESMGLAVYELSDAVFAKAAQSQNPQGVLGVFEKPHIKRDEFFEIANGKNLLLIDRLQDPRNIGTILRTAEAAGFAGAVFIKGSGDPFSPKAVRAAAGASERFPILFTESAGDALAMLKAKGKKIFATAMNANTKYYDADLAKDCVIVISNEGNGVSKEIYENADCIIKIPMSGKTESLNAAMAAGIIMFESRRQQND